MEDTISCYHNMLDGSVSCELPFWVHMAFLSSRLAVILPMVVAFSRSIICYFDHIVISIAHSRVYGKEIRNKCVCL